MAAVGYHRLLVHRSFETYMWIKVMWAILGSMAVQGPLLKWVGMHRWHHQNSDTPEDPHSPQHGGAGVTGLLRGFWHAQVGWLFDADPPDLDRYYAPINSQPTFARRGGEWVIDHSCNSRERTSHFRPCKVN